MYLAMASEKVKNFPVSHLISIFYSISKLFGYAISKPDDSLICRILRELFFFCYLLLTTGCSVRGEMWCMNILHVRFSVQTLILLSITQLILAASASCLISYRMNNVKILKIVSTVRLLEENLRSCNLCVEIVYIGWRGFCLCGLQLFTVLGTLYYSLIGLYQLFMVIDSTCIFYIEISVAIPFLQFVVWIALLCYILHLVQLKITQTDRLEYLEVSNLCTIGDRISRVHLRGYDDDVLRMKRFIGVLKQVSFR